MLFVNGSSVFGQTEDFPTDLPEQLPQPPMKNVFMNVLWGSIAGGTMMTSWKILDDSKEKSERYKVRELTGNFIVGATYGGLVGLVVGVVLSMRSMTFDASRTRIAFLSPPVYGEPTLGHFTANERQFSYDQRQTLVDVQINF